MKQGLSLFATHLSVGIAQDEADGGEEVALARAIATDDDIAVGREGLDLHLILVAGDDEISGMQQSCEAVLTF